MSMFLMMMNRMCRISVLVITDDSISFDRTTLCGTTLGTTVLSGTTTVFGGTACCSCGWTARSTAFLGPEIEKQKSIWYTESWNFTLHYNSGYSVTDWLEMSSCTVLLKSWASSAVSSHSMKKWNYRFLESEKLTRNWQHDVWLSWP